MTEKELKQAITQVLKQHYLGKTVNFGEDAGRFKVRATKIKTRKGIGIERYEFEDYGIDEDTQKFIIVEFQDRKEDMEATEACCCIFTLNSKGQMGTSDTPYDFELEGAYEHAINVMEPRILEQLKNQGDGKATGKRTH